MLRFRTAGLALASLLLVAAPGRDARAIPVDVELALGVDVSGSTDPDEFALMINGYASAFRNPAVQSAIDGGPNGRIAVSMYFWTAVNSNGLHAVKIPFTEVTGASSGAFADAIAALLDPVSELLTPGGPLPIDPPLLEPFFVEFEQGGGIRISGGSGAGSGFTAVAQAIAFGQGLLLADNGFEGTRLVLDISGDGHENVDHNPLGCIDPESCADLGLVISPLDPSIIDDPDLYFEAVIAARNAALAAGVTAINGLPIETDIPDLAERFYARYVIGGDGAFVEVADDFASFGTAISNKLVAEIVPEPRAALLLGLGLAGLAALRRRV